MNAFLLEMALPYVLRATAVLLLAGLATRLLRSRSAALRHRVWVLAIAALALLPLASTALPNLPVVPVPERWLAPAAAPAVSVLPGEDSAVRAMRHARPAAPAPAHSAAATIAPSREVTAGQPTITIVLAAGLVATWAVGALVVLGLALGGLLARVRLRSRCRLRCDDDGKDAEWRAAAASAAADLGLGRPVTLRWSDDVDVPITWGVARPVVVLPAAASAAWDGERRRAVMLHELAHALRGDAAVLLAARAVVAIHWFNPLAWRALARLQAEAELAADDRVLASGFRASLYAGHLLDVARALQARFAAPLAGMAMARVQPPSALERRIRAILATGRPRLALGATASLATLALAAAALIPLAATGCVRVGPKDSFTESSDDERPVGYFAQPRFAGQCAPGFLGAHGRSINVQTRHDGTQHVGLRQAGCQLTIDLAGPVRLGEHGIEQVGAGGSFEVVEITGLGRREVRVTPGAGTETAVRYRVDGKDQAFDDAGRAFLAGVVEEIHRATVIGARERVARIYASGGLQSVLAEIDKISSGYVRQVYLRELIVGVKVGPDELATVIGAAGRLVTSDYELAVTLKAALEAWPQDRPVPDAFYRAVGALDSDYERSQILQKLLRSRPPSEADRLAVIGQLDGVKSDFERSVTLKEVIERQPPSAAEMTAILADARHLSSDYEHGQVLHRLIECRKLEEPEIAALLESIRQIRSGYERTELLTAIARRHQFAGALLDTYKSVAQGLGSDYDQDRALAAALRNSASSRAN